MDFGFIALVLVIILFSMTLHEVMHGFMAYLLGDDTAKLQGRLTLNPVKHIDPFLTIILPVTLALLNGPIFGGAKPVPFNPERVRYGEWGAALVALVGPLTNFFIAFFAFGIYALLGAPSVAEGTGHVLMVVVTVNLGFFIFNMLPIPPLDGSRVLYALAPEFVRRGMEAVERFGLIFIFVIVLLASSIISPIILGGLQFFLQLFVTIFGL